MGVRVSLHAAKDQTCFADNGDFRHLFTLPPLKPPLSVCKRPSYIRPRLLTCRWPSSSYRILLNKLGILSEEEDSCVNVYRAVTTKYHKLSRFKSRNFIAYSYGDWKYSARGWHLPKQGLGVGSVAWLALCFQLLTVSGMATPVGMLLHHCPVWSRLQVDPSLCPFA